jgi:uncharacterized membrane protein
LPTGRSDQLTLASRVDQGDYRPGACNIGPAEIARRRRIGLLQLGAALGLAAVLVVIDAPAWTRIALWPILAGAFITLEQVRRRFCVAFGLAGVRNFGPLGHPQRVEDDRARAADRRSAVILATYCSVAAAVVTAAFVILG